MTTLIRLEILRVLRNRRFLFFTLLYPVILYLAISQSAGSVGGLDAKLYMMVSMAGFGALGASLMTTSQRISQERQKGWVRQLKLTALNQNGYVIAKIASAATTSAPSIVIVLLAGGLVNHVHLGAGQWLGLFASLWIGSFVFAALGVALGYLAAPETVQPIVMITYMGMSLLGGLWMPTEVFPGWLGDIAKVMPTYHFSALGKAVEQGGGPHLDNLAVLFGYLVVFVGAAGWLYRRDKDRG